MSVLLPRTDAGAFVQLVVVLVIGIPMLVLLVRRRAYEYAWLVGGVFAVLLGFFALRTLH